MVEKKCPCGSGREMDERMVKALETGDRGETGETGERRSPPPGCFCFRLHGIVDILRTINELPGSPMACNELRYLAYELKFTNLGRISEKCKGNEPKFTA